MNYSGAMIHNIQLSDGQRAKCHQNRIRLRLRLRHCSNGHSSHIDILRDDLLNKKPQFKPTRLQFYSSSSIKSFLINDLLDTPMETPCQ